MLSILLSNEALKFKPKYKWGFAVLPFALMMLSFLPLWFFTKWLAAAFRISMDTPIRMQSHASYLVLAIIIAMVVLMIAGYVLGFVLNAVFLHFFFGWTGEQLNSVFLRSEIPSHWYKK